MPVPSPLTFPIAQSALVGDTVTIDVVDLLAERNFGSTLTLNQATTDSGPGTARVVNGLASILTTAPGTVIVTYTVANADGVTATDKITLTVNAPPLPDPPVAVDDQMTISSGGIQQCRPAWPTTWGSLTPATEVTVELRNRPPASFGTVTLTNGTLTLSRRRRRQASSC